MALEARTLGPVTTPRAQVCWLFSMTRSGSSVAAYAAAHPWGVPVADEVFTSFEDRTRPPYNFPVQQRALRELYLSVGERLTPEVCALAEDVLARIAGSASGPARRVVSKHPHDVIDVAEFRSAFPHHRAVHLLRNPLHRLNSIYRRNWQAIMGENFDLPRFSRIARRWLEAEHRVTFDTLQRDPAAFFGAVWRAWGWEFDGSHVRSASEYQRTHYHASSAKLSAKKKPSRVFSEARFALPRHVIDLYLNDPFVRPLMERVGWSTDPEAYLSGDADGAE